MIWGGLGLDFRSRAKVLVRLGFFYDSLIPTRADRKEVGIMKQGYYILISKTIHKSTPMQQFSGYSKVLTVLVYSQMIRKKVIKIKCKSKWRARSAGRRVCTEERLADDLITCRWALTGFLRGDRDSPEERAAKRGVFTGCQFGGNEPTL